MFFSDFVKELDFDGAVAVAMRGGGEFPMVRNSAKRLLVDLHSEFRHIFDEPELRDRLLELGCITPETPVYANHFSHNGGALHADLEAFFAPHRIRVAYDGLTVEL